MAAKVRKPSELAPADMTLTELAEAISRRLKRLERDPEWNQADPVYQSRKLYYAGACRAGSRVQVTYVTYQGSTNLTRSDAEAYLAWLRAGNRGTHFDMARA